MPRWAAQWRPLTTTARSQAWRSTRNGSRCEQRLPLLLPLLLPRDTCVSWVKQPSFAHAHASLPLPSLHSSQFLNLGMLAYVGDSEALTEVGGCLWGQGGRAHAAGEGPQWCRVR